MSKWICGICGYVYDEEKEGVPFAALPEGWVCPLCGADRGAFVLEGGARQPPKGAPAPVRRAGEREGLSDGALSAVCSNLARGCEKQYQEEAAARFRTLADALSAAVPPPGADLDGLLGLVQADLSEGYPALSAAAAGEGDRGTQRICVWGEKVTRIQEVLLNRYRREGEAFLKDTQVWVCSVCGFIYVGDSAPDLCPVCKVPAWKFTQVEGRR